MGLKASATCELTFGQHGVPAVGLAARRGARRHRADVRGDRARPDDGRHEGDRHALGRLPHRAGLRQGARAGRRPARRCSTRPRRGCTIIHHPDVRRMLMLQKAYAEGLRALYLYTATFQDEIRVARAAAPTCALAERVNDLLLPIVKGVGLASGRPSSSCSVAADPGRLGLPAGLPDRAVHPRREDRLAVRGHHGDPVAGLPVPQDRPGQRAGARRTSPARSRRSSTPRPATAGSRRSGRCSPPRSPTSRACWARSPATSMASARTRRSIYKVGQHTRPAADGGRRPARRLAAAAPGRGRARRARRRGRPRGPGVLRGQGRAWPGSSPTTALPLLTAQRAIVEHADNTPDGAAEAASDAARGRHAAGAHGCQPAM